MRKGFLALSFFTLLSSCKEELPSSASFEDFRVAIYNGSNKLWSHRANIPDTAFKRLTEFPGIEIDVFFDTNSKKFFVKHDDNEDHHGELSAFLKKTDSVNASAFYWIDFKNLNNQNLNEASIALIQITSERELHKRMIVESFMANEIIALNKENIYTSFWVPHLYNESTAEDTLKALNLIQEVLESQRVNALSAHYPMYDFLNEHFPESNIHLWTNGLHTEQDKSVISDLASKENIKVILVDYQKNFLD